jgi:proteasome lid subunit RPN8/RPN11
MSDLATVAVYPVRSDAEIVRARLASEGVEALVIADDEGGLNPGFYARYGVRVVVAVADLAAAYEALDLDVVIVPEGAVQQMVDHAKVCAPNEACGLIASLDGVVTKVYQLANTDRAPDRFTLDPEDHFAAVSDAENHGWVISGLFHSHPSSAPIPSAVDLEGGGDPDWVNLIVGVEAGRIAVRAYRYSAGAATAVEIKQQ